MAVAWRLARMRFLMRFRISGSEAKETEALSPARLKVLLGA